jgi:hypothetical protein
MLTRHIKGEPKMLLRVILFMSVFALLASPLMLRHSHAAATSPAPVPQTGQTLCYNSAGTVIPCVGTGQDGDINNGIVWPNPRFNDTGNGTVTDNLTGLMWTKNANLPLTYKTWQGALDYVVAMNAGTQANFSYTDWRLPSIRDLQELVDSSRSNPALSVGHPFTSVQSGYYWSATSYAGSTSSAWIVDLNGGRMDYNGKIYDGFVWPVRSGQ